MRTCIDCGWPTEIKSAPGVVVKRGQEEYRYKLGESSPEELAKNLDAILVGLCNIHERDCGCDSG